MHLKSYVDNVDIIIINYKFNKKDATIIFNFITTTIAEKVKTVFNSNILKTYAINFP